MKSADDRRAVHPRRFRLLDAVVLTGATGLALAACRPLMVLDGSFAPLYLGTPSDWFFHARFDRDFFETPYGVYYWAAIGANFLAAWLLALLPLNLCEPRSPRRRWATRPGAVASLSFGVVATIAAASCLILGLSGLLHASPAVGALTSRPYADPRRLFMIVPPATGMAIAASWLMLAIGGRWRSEPSWIDRAGRALGWAWVALTPLYLWVALLSE